MRNYRDTLICSSAILRVGNVLFFRTYGSNIFNFDFTISTVEPPPALHKPPREPACLRICFTLVFDPRAETIFSGRSRRGVRAIFEVLMEALVSVFLGLGNQAASPLRKTNVLLQNLSRCSVDTKALSNVTLPASPCGSICKPNSENCSPPSPSCHRYHRALKKSPWESFSSSSLWCAHPSTKSGMREMPVNLWNWRPMCHDHRFPWFSPQQGAWPPPAP